MPLLDIAVLTAVALVSVSALLHFGTLLLLKWQSSTWRVQGSPTEKAPSVLIIGAGLGGLGMAIQCRKAGIAFTVVEKGPGVGGTWMYNKYPGAGCDVPSHVYSFSFEPNPVWTCKWARQPEILAYIESLWKKYNLLPRLRLNTEVVWAKFVDTKEGVWLVCLRGPDGKETTVHVGVVVSAVGQLSHPVFPSIPGRETFQGQSFHSAQWDHSISLEGKSVICIGTGASAAQFVPLVTPQVKQLYVCQRSPAYLIPKDDYKNPPWVLWMFTYCPFIRLMYRGYCFLLPDLGFFPALKRGWCSRQVTRLFQREMTKKVPPHLIPSYPFGCKRTLFDDGFSSALKSPNVEVVSETIDRITANGIVLKPSGRELSADVLIYATGFNATAFALPKIEGTKKTLEESWNGSPRAFWGITVSGFPNFFMLYGPNTNLGHNSIIFMLECQINYVMQAIRELTTQPHRWFDLKPGVFGAYLRTLRAMLARTVWADPSCTSWYKSSDGDVVTNSPVNCLTYWWKTRVFRFLDYTHPDAEQASSAAPSSTSSSSPSASSSSSSEEDDPFMHGPPSSWESLLSESPLPPSVLPTLPTATAERPFPWPSVVIVVVCSVFFVLLQL